MASPLIYGRLTMTARGGCPYAGGAHVYFAPSDIAAVGKVTTFGPLGFTRTMVRLDDGREVFVLVYQQAPDLRRWLRERSAAVREPIPTRAIGFAFAWVEIDNNERQAA